MKKSIVCIAIVFFLLCLLQIGPVQVNAETLTSGDCGDSAKWDFDAATGTLTISGTGVMPAYARDKTPWNAHKDDIKKIVIQEGITEIGFNAFIRTKVEEAEIAASVEKIGALAFGDCAYLKRIIFAGSVQNIDMFAFASVTATAFYPESESAWADSQKDKQISGKLTWQINLGDGGRSGVHGDLKWEVKDATLYLAPKDGVKSTFMGPEPAWLAHNQNIEKVVMSGTIEDIGYGAFGYCTKLTEVQWPSGLKIISTDAFKNCKSLTAITLPDTVTDIGGFAFYGCDGLKTIQLSKDLSYIDVNAFEGCSKLESITIPINVGSLRAGAFKNCTSLKTIYFNGYMPSMDAPERVAGSVISPGVIRPAAFHPGSLSQIGGTVTVYYPEGELTWSAEDVEKLNELYASENVTFAPYSLKNQEPDTTPTETNPVTPTDPSQPIPTESTPTQETTQSTIPATEGSATATEPSDTSEDADNTKNALIFVGAGIVLLGLAAFGIFFLKPRFARSKQE